MSSARVVAALATSLLIATAVAAPAGAEPLPDFGELLTAPADSCGVLTMTPNNPVAGDEVTVTLEGGQREASLYAAVYPGVIIAGQWVPVFTPGDPEVDNGYIDSDLGNAVAAQILETDGNGDATSTFMYPYYDEYVSTPPSGSDDNGSFGAILFGFLPHALVLHCGEGSDTTASYVDVRPGRERLEGTARLSNADPTVLTGSGYPSEYNLLGLIAPTIDGLSAIDSLWVGLLTDGPETFIAEITTDADGAFSIEHGLGDLDAGGYVVAFIALPSDFVTTSASVSDLVASSLRRASSASSTLSSAATLTPAGAPFIAPPVLKQEWVVTVDDAGFAAMSRVNGTAASTNAPVAQLAETGLELPWGVPVGLAALLTLGAMLVVISRGVRRTSA